MTNYKKYITTLILLLITIATIGQSKIDSLENMLNQKIEDTTRLKVLLNLGKEYSRKDFEKALEYANQLLQLSQSIDDKNKMSYAYNLIGSSYNNLNYSFDSTFEMYQKGTDLADEIKDFNAKGRLLNNMGELHKKFGKKSKALSFHQQAYTIAKENNDKKLAIYCLNNIAILFDENNQLDLAKNYYFEGLKYAKELNNQRTIAYLNNNLALIYYEENVLDSALVLYNETLEINKKINDDYVKSTVLSNIGDLYVKQKNYSKAIAFFEESNKIAISLKNSYNIGLALSGLSRVYYEQGNYEKAISNGKAALDAFGENGSIILRLNCYNYLANSYEALNNYKSALENQKLYQTFSDSLFNTEKTEQINDLKIQYEVKEKEIENQLLKAKTDTAQKMVRQRTYAVGGLLLALLFAVILVISTYKSNQKRKQLNKQLEKNNQQLKDVDKAKTQFFTNLSHELKTPLTLILNPLQKVLKSRQLNEANQYLIKLAEKNSLQLFDLVYQILELTKFEANKASLNLTTIKLKDKIGKLYADFESLAVSRGIDFQLIDNTEEALWIQADDYKLTTVIKNLISNAIKFTSQDGKVTINVEEKAGKFVFRISDTGRGIHPQDLPYVFNRYFQTKVSGDIMEGGTGIGLAICKEYIDLMDGKINVKSTLGKGSIFIIELPKIVSESTVFEVESEESLTKAIPFSTINQSKNETMPTVLVVEDNINMQEYLTYILNDYYNVIITQNGKAALEILNNGEIVDLVITDLMMPEMNGQELVEAMKNMPQLAGVPVIMLTALSQTDEKLKALRVGIDDYILKPFIDEELIARIDNLIANSEERRLYQQMSDEASEADSSLIANKNISINQEDLEWLKQFEEIVQANYKDFDFSIDNYTEVLMMSRTNIYRKIKSLTGLTPKSYVNEIRFQAARKLIENKTYSTAKAVAYEVGFKNQKYFSSIFKKRFGKSPSEYLK